MKKTLLACTILSTLNFTANAQEALEPDSAQSETKFEVIEVTAQRRPENLQDVPIAATALAGDKLQDRGIERVSDLQNASPSVSITDTGITLSVNIRGIGIASDSPNITAGVATYVDGLFQPPIVQANSFYDLQSVEILRGPQGTFVGSNSTGGAIFINSKNPVFDDFSGYIQASAGNYSNTGFEGALNLPVSDSFALRVAGFQRERDSFYQDIGPFNNDAGKLDEHGFRIGALWQPTEAFRALLKLQNNERETGGYAYQPIQGTQFSGSLDDDIRTLSFDEETANKDSADIASLELRYELANGITLRSLSGYQDKTIHNLYDNDGSQQPIEVGARIRQDYTANEKQLSEELNIISPTGEDLDWIAGLYYQFNDITVDIFERQNLAPGLDFPTDIVPRNERTTTGVFAQVNYQLSQALELQAGLRHSTYKATGTGSVTIGAGFPDFPPSGIQVSDLSGAHKDNNTTGKLALNWQVSKDTLVFGFVSKGYKPGGFNSLVSEFDPEEVISYETGLKTTVLDKHVRMQVNAYYNDYSNFQFSILDTNTGFGGVENFADLKIKGVEAQIQASYNNFSADLNVGYVDSELPGASFVNQSILPLSANTPRCAQGVENGPTCFNYGPFIVSTNGGDALYSPKLTYSIALRHAYELAAGWFIDSSVNYAFVDKQFSYLAYSEQTDLIDSRALLSANVSLSNEQWKVEVYGTNLTDKAYVSGRFGNNLFYGAPREFGVRVKYQF